MNSSLLFGVLRFGSIGDQIGDVFKKLMNYIILGIDSIVYWFIKLINQVFFLVVETDLNGEAVATKINELMNRIYVILGVGMLFFIAYKIICLMSDPEKFTQDGNDSMQGIAKNVVISVIMLTLIPTAFNYLMKFQSRVLTTNVIGSIILGTSSEEDDLNVKEAGAKVAMTIYSAFYYPITEDGDIFTYDRCKDPAETNKPDICETYVAKYDEAVETGKLKEFITDSELNDAYVDGQMDHIAIIPVLAGAYAVWLYLLFTLDVATRAIKLLFYRLIAPVPVMMRITKPVGGAFTKWINDVIKTYISLFIRLLVINFSLFTINLIVSLDLSSLFPSTATSGDAVGFAVLLAKIAVLLGILQFAKDAPKLFEDLFGLEGLDTGTAGLKNRLNQNEFAKRAAVGAGALGMGAARSGWNFAQSRLNKNSEQYKKRQKRIADRDAYRERRKQYREGLSGAGRVADSAAHGVASALGAVGAAGRAAAGVVGTAARGIAAGNVDLNDIGNTIKSQDAANARRQEEARQKRQQRRERATKNGLNTGSYFFPSVQGAIGNIIDGIPDKPVAAGQTVGNGQQTQKDVGAWLTSMVDNALGTTSTARVAQDKAAISDAKAALARGTDLKCMSGDDTALDAEKASRQSAVYNSTQQEVSKENVSYSQKVAAVESAAVQQKQQTVTSAVANYTSQVETNYQTKCAQIDANASLTADEKNAAKVQARTEADAQKVALNSTDLATVTSAITQVQAAQVSAINANASLTDAQKTAQIQAVNSAVTATVTGLTQDFSNIETALTNQKVTIDAEHSANLSNIATVEATSIKNVNADIKKKKLAAKVKKCREDADTLAVAYNVDTENKIMSSIAKMSPESQSAIYGEKMAKVLGLDGSGPGKEPTPENIQKQLRATFSDIRNKNISENTVQVLEQFKKSLGSALSISELSAVNAGGNKGGDK